MPVKDYYVILGVSRNESAAGIRGAYRQLAQRLHPDRVGQEGTAAFQEIGEAYSVLLDPGRRQRHDRALGESERGEPFRRRPVEPPAPISLFQRHESVYPSFEEFFDRYQRNFTESYAPKSEQPEGLTLDVVLSPLEAMVGCAAPIGVPVFRVCPTCRGTGRDWLFPCLDCGAAGYFEDTRTLWAEIPPHVRAGAVLEFPLDSFGIRNLYLRLHVSISGEM